MSSPGVLDGTRPYRFLDETSVSNGYVRLRALLLLPALLVLLAGLILGYELGSPVEDRDARDAAWDYRTTATQSPPPPNPGWGGRWARSATFGYSRLYA